MSGRDHDEGAEGNSGEGVDVPPGRVEPFLERDAELSELRRELSLARRGDGRLVMIEGPPGIGKTRLIAETFRIASEEGVLSLRSRASRLERGFAYGVVRQLFEPVLRDTRAGSELLAGQAALAGPLFGHATEPSGLETANPLQALHGLLWLTINLSERRPLVLAIDDAQWADPPSLRFLSYLGRRLDGLPVLMLVAQRSEAEDGSARDAAIALAAIEHRTLRPAPLGDVATAAIVRAALGQAADPAFCRSCRATTGGNPLLLRELMRAMAARRVAPTAAHVADVSDLGPAAVSQTVRIRLAELPREATRLAEAAAVLGDDRPLPQVAALAELDPQDATRAARHLQRVEVLAPGTEIAFVHPVVRDALRAGIEAISAERIHSRAAAILEEAGAADEAIAEHLLQVPPTGDATSVETLRDAARGLVSAGDGATAASYLRRALAEPPPAELRVPVLLELAEAEILVDGPAAVAHLEEALEHSDEPMTRAAVAARLASFLPSGRPEEAMARGLDAIEALGDGEPGLRRQILAIVGTGAAMRSPRDGIPSELLASMRAEEEAGDEGGRALAAVLAYRSVWCNDPLAEALPRAERAFEGDAVSALATAGTPLALGVIAVLAMDSQVASRAIDDWLAYARRTGELAQYGGAKMFSAHLQASRGELADAEQDAEDALEAMEAWGMSGVAVAHAAGALAAAALERGELSRAEAAIRRARCSDHEAGALGLHGLLAVRARLRAAAGEPRVALGETLELGRRFTELGGEGPALLPWRSWAALLLLSLEDADQAKELVSAELERARAWGGARALGRSLAAAGIVFGGERGIDLLEEAVSALDGLPAPLEQARAYLGLGCALHRARSPRHARDPLRHALQLAQRCGASPLEERIRAELLTTGARARRTAFVGPGALSRREADVARLATDGRTNREIAEELYLTPRTVETYLSRAYRKLGIRSRAELADALAEVEPGEH